MMCECDYCPVSVTIVCCLSVTIVWCVSVTIVR